MSFCNSLHALYLPDGVQVCLYKNSFNRSGVECPSGTALTAAVWNSTSFSGLRTFSRNNSDIRRK